MGWSSEFPEKSTEPATEQNRHRSVYIGRDTDIDFLSHRQLFFDQNSAHWQTVNRTIEKFLHGLACGKGIVGAQNSAGFAAPADKHLCLEHHRIRVQRREGLIDFFRRVDQDSTRGLQIISREHSFGLVFSQLHSARQVGE